MRLNFTMAAFRFAPCLLFLLCASIVCTIPALNSANPMADKIRRWPGDPNSRPYLLAGRLCNASDPSSWEIYSCTRLLDCVLDNVSEIQKSDIAIGSTIAGLLPTILMFAAARPNELIPQALVSPHRAIATAAFSIGVPLSIFEGLRPLRWWRRRGRRISSRQLSRTWYISLGGITPRASYIHVLVKLLADGIILAALSVMLWQFWDINGTVAVQWKCEAPIMIICWPLICILWVMLAILLLYTMAEEVVFEHALTQTRYGWWKVFCLPYTMDMRLENRRRWMDWGVLLNPRKWNLPFTKRVKPSRNEEALDTSATTDFEVPNQDTMDETESSADEWRIRIIVKMPKDGVLFNWQVYDFIVDLLGIVTYLYATFTFLSALFLGSVRALRFTSLMAGLYALVRVVGIVI